MSTSKRIIIYAAVAAAIAGGVWFEVNRRDAALLAPSKEATALFAKITANKDEIGSYTDPAALAHSGVVPPTLKILQPGTGIHAAAATPDGKYIVTVSHDGAAMVWDRTGKLVRELLGHEGPLYAVAISPDGARAATAGKDKTVIVWELRNGEVIAVLSGSGDDIHHLAWLKDGTLLSAGDDGALRRWDVDADRLLMSWNVHHEPITGLSVTRDGTRAATVSVDGLLISWDMKKNRLGWRTTFANSDKDDAGPALEDVAFSADGSRIYVLPWAGTIREVDAATGDPLRTFPTPGGASAIAVYPTGEKLIVQEQLGLSLWSIKGDVNSLSVFETNGRSNSILVDPTSGLLLASAGGTLHSDTHRWTRDSGAATCVWDLTKELKTAAPKR